MRGQYYLNTSDRWLLCTFLYLGLHELNDLNRGASSRLKIYTNKS